MSFARGHIAEQEKPTVLPPSASLPPYGAFGDSFKPAAVIDTAKSSP
jgi:hypothetical protein